MNAMAGWTRLTTVLDGVALAHRLRPGVQPILMVHGIGPGTTGEANFRRLIDVLPGHHALHVIDLAGFGASGRLPAPPYFDVDFWLRQIGQAVDMVAGQHGRPPLLVGNSVGGALVLKAAARHPALCQVLAIGAPAAGPAPAALRAFWRAPADAAALAAAMRPMTGAEQAPEPHLVAARLQPFLGRDYGRYFNAMLADPDACLEAAALTAVEADSIKAGVTVLHGSLDRACPIADTLARLLPLLPAADLTVFGGCGHNVIAERLDDVCATVERLAKKVDLA